MLPAARHLVVTRFDPFPGGRHFFQSSPNIAPNCRGNNFLDVTLSHIDLGRSFRNRFTAFAATVSRVICEVSRSVSTSAKGVVAVAIFH